MLALTAPYEQNFTVLLEVRPRALAETCTQPASGITLWSGAIAGDEVTAIHVRSGREMREMRARDYDGLPGAGLPLAVSPHLFRDDIDEPALYTVRGGGHGLALPACANLDDIDRCAALLVAVAELSERFKCDRGPFTALVESDWRGRPAMSPVVLASGACALLAGPSAPPAEVMAIVTALMGTPPSSGLEDVLAALGPYPPLRAAAANWLGFLDLAARFADDDPSIEDLSSDLLGPHSGALLLWSCEPDRALACADAWPGSGADTITRIIAGGYSALVLGLDATLRKTSDRGRYAPVIAGLVKRVNQRTAQMG